MPSLFVYQGQDQGALFELEEGTLGMGRDAANHIQVHDTEVSRRHAEIRYDGTVCIVSTWAARTARSSTASAIDEHCSWPAATSCRSAAR